LPDPVIQRFSFCFKHLGFSGMDGGRAQGTGKRKGGGILPSRLPGEENCVPSTHPEPQPSMSFKALPARIAAPRGRTESSMSNRLLW